jgi:hypothetical protein
MDQAGVFAEMEGKVGDKGTVGKEGNGKDRIRDHSQSGESVDEVLVKVTSYLRTITEGRRRRNERFW